MQRIWSKTIYMVPEFIQVALKVHYCLYSTYLWKEHICICISYLILYFRLLLHWSIKNLILMEKSCISFYQNQVSRYNTVNVSLRSSAGMWPSKWWGKTKYRSQINETITIICRFNYGVCYRTVCWVLLQTMEPQ